MTTINTYLTFNGNCEEAFDFYKTVFGVEFDHIGRFGEMPESTKFPVAEEDKNKVMHVSLQISDASVLMGSDTGGEWSAKFNQGNNFSISISTDSQAEADRLSKDLSQGGRVIMPMNKTFWGSYFGMFTDKFGIQWMVSFGEADKK